MLTFVMTTAGPQPMHEPTSPLVYLDHCGLRIFSEDPALASRLSSALHARGGSLALSWLNVSEYAPVDPEQRRMVERLIDAVIPEIFCLEVEPFTVAEREQMGARHPHADAPLAAALLRRHQGTVRPFTTAGLLDGVEALAPGKDALARRVQERLRELQQECTTDPDFRNAVKLADSSPRTMAATRMLTIVRALVGTLIEDGTTNITPNDALDFLHATVPSAYCDVVLLDGGWLDRVERARRKLAKAEPPIRLAEVFSPRLDGIERFLAHLEGVGVAARG